MNRFRLLVTVTILLSFFPEISFGALGAVPSAGITAASVLVGGGGVANSIWNFAGNGWGARIFQGVAGSAIVAADPDPSVFFSGQVTIDYPVNLEAVDAIYWFGSFAQDPSLPAPPAFSTPFFPSNAPFAVQPPNPQLAVTTTNANGVLTVKFDAPNGIDADGSGPFNFMGIVFRNISGQELEWNVAGSPAAKGAGGGAANLFEDTSQTSFICIPVDDRIPVACGESTPPYSYTVNPVPEPSFLIAVAFGLGLLPFFVARRSPENIVEYSLESMTCGPVETNAERAVSHELSALTTDAGLADN